MSWAYANTQGTALVSSDGSTSVPCDPMNSDYQAVIASGAQIGAFVAPPAPPASCALWQLQAVMSPSQWAAAQTAVAALGNPAVSAFFEHGTNVIPSNSATLLSLGAVLGLSADQVTALVQQASQVAIP